MSLFESCCSPNSTFACLLLFTVRNSLFLCSGVTDLLLSLDRQLSAERHQLPLKDEKKEKTMKKKANKAYGT